MKPFHTVAIPHRDILEGRLTMDIFAADLWETFTLRAPEDYRDPDIFFEKTYLTEGLKNIMDIVERRLKGLGGDPVIQIQTPFGGGKTHSLIAMYHKAKTWHALDRPSMLSTFLAPESEEVMSAAITPLNSRPICLISSRFISSLPKLKSAKDM